MNYSVRMVSEQFMKDKYLNKDRIQEHIKEVKKQIEEAPLEVPGVVAVYRKYGKWIYISSLWWGENPTLTQAVKVKYQSEPADVIAIIKEKNEPKKSTDDPGEDDRPGICEAEYQMECGRWNTQNSCTCNDKRVCNHSRRKTETRK